MGWLLFLGLKEGLVKCATVCIKSEVIVTRGLVPGNSSLLCVKKYAIEQICSEKCLAHVTAISTRYVSI